MKLITIFLLLCFSNSYASKNPSEFEFDFIQEIYHRCIFKPSCVYTRGEIKSMLEKFDEHNTRRMQLVEDLIPVLTLKFEAIEMDYLNAHANPGIHPKSKEILSEILGEGSLGKRLRKTLDSIKKADEEYLARQEKASGMIQRLLQTVVDYEEKPATISDEEVRRFYIAQKKIEIRNHASSVYSNVQDISIFATEFFGDQYTNDKNSLFLPHVWDESCFSKYEFFLDGRTDHLKVLQIIVGDGVKRPVKVECRRVSFVPKNATFNKKSRVLTIPYKRYPDDFWGNSRMTFPKRETILDAIVN